MINEMCNLFCGALLWPRAETKVPSVAYITRAYTRSNAHPRSTMKFHILLSSLSLCVGLASASDSMKRPDNFKEIIDPLTSFHVSKQGRLRPDLKFNWGGKVNMAYFTSW